MATHEYDTAVFSDEIANLNEEVNQIKSEIQHLNEDLAILGGLVSDLCDEIKARDE